MYPKATLLVVVDPYVVSKHLEVYSTRKLMTFYTMLSGDSQTQPACVIF